MCACMYAHTCMHEYVCMYVYTHSVETCPCLESYPLGAQYRVRGADGQIWAKRWTRRGARLVNLTLSPSSNLQKDVTMNIHAYTSTYTSAYIPTYMHAQISQIQRATSGSWRQLRATAFWAQAWAKHKCDMIDVVGSNSYLITRRMDCHFCTRTLTHTLQYSTLGNKILFALTGTFPLFCMHHVSMSTLSVHLYTLTHIHKGTQYTSTHTTPFAYCTPRLPCTI